MIGTMGLISSNYPDCESPWWATLIRSGELLKPWLTAIPYNKADWKQGIPEDGEIITDRTYEDLKRERTSG